MKQNSIIELGVISGNKLLIGKINKRNTDRVLRSERNVDKNLRFDYFNREGAIKDLFRTTADPNVKQVLRFAMELNNQYRNEAMELYYILNIIQASMRDILNNTENTIDKTYL